MKIERKQRRVWMGSKWNNHLVQLRFGRPSPPLSGLYNILVVIVVVVYVINDASVQCPRVKRLRVKYIMKISIKY